jgi:hypothetical protein
VNNTVPMYSVIRRQASAKAIQWTPSTGHPWVRLPCAGYTEEGEPILDLPGYGYVLENSRGGRELVVRSGNWVVEDLDGSRTVLSHEDFKAQYETLRVFPG